MLYYIFLYNVENPKINIFTFVKKKDIYVPYWNYYFLLVYLICVHSWKKACKETLLIKNKDQNMDVEKKYTPHNFMGFAWWKNSIKTLQILPYLKKKENPNVFFISNKLANSLTFFRHFSLIQFFMDQLPLMRICEVWILVIVLAPSYFSCAFEIICNQLPPHACHAIPALYSCQSIFLGLSKSMVGGLCNWHHKGNLEKTKMKSRFRSFRRATHALNSMENLF